MDQGWLITVIMNGLKPDLSAEVIKADPHTLEDLRDVTAKAEVAEQCQTTTPALQESTNLAPLNALQEIREDVRENRQQHQRHPYYQPRREHPNQSRFHAQEYQRPPPRYQVPAHGQAQPPRHA